MASKGKKDKAPPNGKAKSARVRKNRGVRVNMPSEIHQKFAEMVAKKDMRLSEYMESLVDDALAKSLGVKGPVTSSQIRAAEKVVKEKESK